MHLGKYYPFHPRYWCTEAWFWPGFVPWKMLGQTVATNAPPWDVVGTWYPTTSDVGNPSTDAKKIEYHWTMFPPNGDGDLVLTLDLAEYSGLKYARWKLEYIPTAGPILVAFLFQPFPQRLIDATGVQLWSTEDPTIPPDGPTFVFGPATYAEGGSPYP